MIGSTAWGGGALLIRSSHRRPDKTWLLRKNESLAASATFHEQLAIPGLAEFRSALTRSPYFLYRSGQVD